MPANILVPLDGSSFSEQAVQYALGAARRSDATLHLVRVHVAPVASDPVHPWHVDGVVEATVREQENDYLERFASIPRACGIDVRTSVLTGVVVNAIAEYVRAERIDQVIMTTHGRGGLSRVWLGSVADSLVRYVDVPIVLLRPRSEHGAGGAPFSAGRILLPVDGSEWSERVVEEAIAFGSSRNAHYTLLHVLAPPLAMAPGAEVVATPDVVEFRANAISSLEKLAGQLRARGLSVDTAVVMQTQVALGIIEYAMECRADLIAMATHARSGIMRVMLGSVADKVLRTTHVPLLLLPPSIVHAESVSALAS